jgi:hypothetical protein
MADGSVIAVKVADGAVTTTKIANGSITSDKIADSAIVTVKLADGSVTSAKILDGSVTAADLATGAVTTIKIADGSVTSAKLAAGAIPYVSAYASGLVKTNSTSLVDMPDMAVNITLDRTSYLLIMFSAVAENLDIDSRVLVAAQIGLVPVTYWSWVTPQGEVYLTPTNQVLRYSSHGFNWYQPSVTAGTYTVKIEWRVNGGEGHVMTRTLIVIAFPA